MRTSGGPWQKPEAQWPLRSESGLWANIVLLPEEAQLLECQADFTQNPFVRQHGGVHIAVERWSHRLWRVVRAIVVETTMLIPCCSFGHVPTSRCPWPSNPVLARIFDRQTIIGEYGDTIRIALCKYLHGKEHPDCIMMGSHLLNQDFDSSVTVRDFASQ
jgi:hypothetical protein